MRSGFRGVFLEGVYANGFGKGAFKCAHIAEQLKDCGGGARGGAGREHDVKVCDILKWEEALCWSRWIAAKQFAEVQKCYAETDPRERARCDPPVMALRAAVDAVRANTSVDVLRGELEPNVRAAVDKCPDIASIKDERLANHAMSCLTRQIDKEAYTSFWQCIKSAKDEPEKCLQDERHVVLMKQLGTAYAFSKAKQTFQ